MGGMGLKLTPVLVRYLLNIEASLAYGYSASLIHNYSKQS